MNKALNEFLDDVLNGFNTMPKYLPSKYLYDDKGDKLFQQKMEMSAYYLTNSEYEILSQYKHDIQMIFQDNVDEFKLIELGVGDGKKTNILLEYFLNKDARFSYIPIDISSDVLEQLKNDLCAKYPDLNFQGIHGDFFDALKVIPSDKNIRKVVLFLGSTIGNLGPGKEIDFFRKIAKSLKTDDILLTGFDLIKSPKIIRDAYTYAPNEIFYKNIFQRINNELGGDFDLDNFEHHFDYNPVSGLGRTFIVSKKEQTLTLGYADKTIAFKAWEPIQINWHQKYDIDHIQHIAEQSGFNVNCNLYDRRKYFVDSLWCLK